MSPLAKQTLLILRNDLRLLWRDVKVGRFKEFLSIPLFAGVFTLLHVISISLFFTFRREPPLAAETLVWLFFASLMMGAAMNQAISVLFERADFDLLLASPVAPRAVLLARLAAMLTGAALSITLLFFPLLHGAILALSWHYAAGYVVWLLLAGAVSSAGVWFTLLLVKWLGPRRARLWAQIVASLLGASIFLVAQSANLLPSVMTKQRLAVALRFLGEPPLSLIASAGRGEWRPLLGLALITAVFVALTTQLLARIFVGGVQDAAAIAPPARGNGRRYVFKQGVARATFWKDVRLILRDPLLIIQVLPTALYLLPAFFGFAQANQGAGVLPYIAPFALVIASQFSVAFTAISASGEECWDLIRMSPTPELRLRLAKMAAGMALPLGLCAALCVTLALLGHPWLALVALVVSTVCASGCSWLQVAQVTPTPRRDILKPRTGVHAPTLKNLLSVLITMIGAAGLGFASGSHWIVASVLLGIMTLAVVGCFTLFQMENIKVRHFQTSP